MANTQNIVGCYMLRPFAHPVACCWVLLGVADQIPSGQILRHQSGFSLIEAQTSILQNVPSGEEQGEVAVFAG